MKLIVVAGSAMATMAAGPPTPLDQPSYEEPARAWTSIEDARPSAEECRQRIQHVRDQTGKPTLDRSPASPDKPMLMYAVDQKLDGCSVIVPVSDPSDLRQAPEPRPPELIPALPGR
jgi:hypothetical protein